MELNGLFPIIKRWIAVIVVATAMAAFVGLLLGSTADKTYEAKAQVLVGPLSTDSDTMRASADLSQTFAELATSGAVLEKVATELELSKSELKTGVRATANSATRFLVVRARSHDPQDAAKIANAVALELIALGQQDPTRPEGQLRVIDPAKAPSAPVSPRLELIVPLAAVAGLLGSLTLVLLFEFVGDTAESTDKVDALTGVPTLSTTRRRSRIGTKDDRATLDPYRVIATQIDLAAPDVRCVLLTGVTADDGTADVALQLAEQWSQRRPSVTILDSGTGDITLLVRQDQRGDTGKPSSHGIHREAIQWGSDGPSTPEALTENEARDLRDLLEADGGLVIVHGQPATVSSATLVWARVADVTVLSVRRFQARRSAITDTIANLRAVDAHLVMSILHDRTRLPGVLQRGRSTSSEAPAPPDLPAPADLQSPADLPAQAAGAPAPAPKPSAARRQAELQAARHRSRSATGTPR